MIKKLSCGIPTKIALLLLILTINSCKKDLTSGAYRFDVKINGESFSWTSNIPSSNSTGSCVWVQNGESAYISIVKRDAIGEILNLGFNIPSQTGTFEIYNGQISGYVGWGIYGSPNDPQALNFARFGGFYGSPEKLLAGFDNKITIKINKITSSQSGNIEGTFSGEVTVVTQEQVPIVRNADISGSFVAWKIN